MIDHVTLRVAAIDASERFYRAVLPTLGIDVPTAGSGFIEWEDFSIAAAGPERPPTRNLHVAFVAPTRAHVDAFWRAGVDAGHPSAGEPGPRPQYTADYYGAFLLDPDGNSAEAVHHAATRRDGNIDHLWIRVADLDAAEHFYATIAPHAGLRAGATEDRLRQFRGASGSFALVDGGASCEHVHLAFAAPGRATVDAFHRTAIRAGFRDNGAPGERPEYHPGYYGAYVLDPDGNNVEVVFHDRDRAVPGPRVAGAAPKRP